MVVQAQVLTFEQFEIRLRERVLLVQGERVSLGGKAFDVLVALAERCDRVVSKAELLDLAWPGVVVEDNNLSVQITALRRVLGADSITTVTGRGYRLSATPLDAQALAMPPTPETVRLERRLAAIVQADVVGWARLVARDPMVAAQSWGRTRQELIERSVPRFGGRLLELTAERVLVEFSSAVEAVAWSVELQALLADRREQVVEGETDAMHMRIGIAVDDVIVDDGKLVGDGVNVAADLQISAGHDDVLVTHKVRDFVGQKLDVQFLPLGERLMRRTRRPMLVFRALPASRARAQPTVRPLQPMRMASIAVLPLVGDAATELDGDSYFGDGITEEIIASLSLNRSLFVIAHGSTLRYRGQQTDLAAVADELGVRYLVTGSVRRAGSQLRIHVSLILAADQRILWQERYDGSTEDLFGFQSQIALSVAAAMAPPVQDEEMARVRQRPTQSYDAYDCVLRGMAGLHQLGAAEFDAAGDLFRRAIALDPSYAQAHAQLAWWYSLNAFEGRLPHGTAETPHALEHAMEAVRLDGKDAVALSVAGYIVTMQRQHDEALELFERALTINPSCAAAWARSGAALFYMGRGDESLERVQRAMRLSPYDQMHFWHLTICGGACLVSRRYDEAAGWLGKALRLKPRFNGARRLRVAALALAGELDEARDLARELQAESPDFSLQAYREWSALRPPQLEEVVRGLRLAGLPD